MVLFFKSEQKIFHIFAHYYNEYEKVFNRIGFSGLADFDGKL